MSKHHLYGQCGNIKMHNGGYEGFTDLKYTTGHQSFDESFDMVLCLYNGIYTNTNYTCVSFSEFIPFIPDKALNEANS